MTTLIRKLSSRKLWLAVAGITTGVAVALGADASEVETVAGAVTALVSAVSYMVAEGMIDAARVKSAIEATQEAVEVVKNERQ